MTTRIEWTATPAVAGGQRQRETKTTQQEHVEECRVDASERTCWTSLECSPCSRTSLRPEQRPLRFSQHSKQRFPLFLFDPGGRFILPSRLLLFLVVGRPQTGFQCPPTEGFKTTHACQSVCRFCCRLHTLPVWISFQLSNDSGSHLRRALITGKQSAQLVQNPAILVLDALLKPSPPRTRGRVAALLAATSHKSGVTLRPSGLKQREGPTSPSRQAQSFLLAAGGRRACSFFAEFSTLFGSGCIVSQHT